MNKEEGANKGRLVCRSCGIECVNETHRRNHEAAHVWQQPNDAFCSVCCESFANVNLRNDHEHRCHYFKRYHHDWHDRRAIRLSWGQLQRVENVGFLFDRIQAHAKLSAEEPKWSAMLPATMEDVVHRMLSADRIKPDGESVFDCGICSTHCIDFSIRLKHELAHEMGAKYRCSVCAFLLPSPPLRFKHELQFHGYIRPVHTREWTEAVKIPPDEWSQLPKVQQNFLAIQRRTARSPTDLNRRAPPAVEPWEASLLRPIAPPPPVEPLRPSNEREERSFSALPPTSQQTNDRQSLGEWLLDRMERKQPTVLFFDLQQASHSFTSTLIDRWLSDANCKLLLLRSTTADWSREPAALERLLATSLRLDGGRYHLLIFAKRDAGRLLGRFVRAAPHVRCFSTALETVGRLVACDRQEFVLVFTHEQTKVPVPPNVDVVVIPSDSV
ncbi:hypothetical protein M3Y99_00511500 [Aphelenchoides fujianensis]|nr:hypothetical protein M3Y99_00511500 [Aphelenchoides fujianensis]